MYAVVVVGPIRIGQVVVVVVVERRWKSADQRVVCGRCCAGALVKNVAFDWSD